MTAQLPPATLATVMRAEATAIGHAAARMDSAPARAAVGVLTECAGKVIVSGVGKSGLVAQKFAASLTSVGQMAVYLNPLDALHGDIGIVQAGDVVVLVSNSGETSELIALLPFLQKRGVHTIGILGRVTSTLGRQCTAVLDASVAHEAAPIEQVPTSSTAVAMAVGDGLLVEWMTARGVSVYDFAVNHPAGAIGRRLTLTVADVMIPLGRLQFVTREAPLPEVIEALTAQGIGAVMVTHQSNNARLGGIITDGDLRRGLRRTAGEHWPTLTADDLMTSSPVTTSSSVLAAEALALMERNSKKAVTVLPVVDNEHVVGMLRMHDLVQAGLA